MKTRRLRGPGQRLEQEKARRLSGLEQAKTRELWGRTRQRPGSSRGQSKQRPGGSGVQSNKDQETLEVVVAAVADGDQEPQQAVLEKAQERSAQGVS